MLKTKYFHSYVSEFVKLVQNVDLQVWSEIEQSIRSVRDLGQGKVIVLGNGGSSAIAEHASIDFTKAADVPCITLSSASMLSCFANDFGYENSQLNYLKYYAEPGDVVILISSSGNSDNILNCANHCVEAGLTFYTLTGFSENSKLRQIDPSVNIWIPASHYNHVENAHQLVLLSICDSLRES